MEGFSVAWAGGFYAANWVDNARNGQVLPSYVTHYDVVGVGPEGAHWTAVLLLKIQVFLLDVQVQMSAVFCPIAANVACMLGPLRGGGG